MKNILNKINLRLNEVFALVELTLAAVISLFVRKKNIWLICERGTDARDNGFWFYKYVKDHHPEIYPIYIISEDSPDRQKILDNGFQIINYKSFKHIVYLVKAQVLISTHKNGFSPWQYSSFFKSRWILGRKKTVSLRHGIGIHYTPILHKNDANLSLIISGSAVEHKFIIENYGYNSIEAVYTGLPRFDNLVDESQNDNLILVMPTWRKYLDKGNIADSEYVRTFKSLLTSSKLNDILDKNNYKLIFYPHHEIQPYIGIFKNSVNNPRVIIADKGHYDVQNLLKKSKLLITDYSSVFFDFAYMRKPVIYYQFDEQRYHKEHYQKGYFDYTNGFGPCVNDESAVLNELERLIINGFKIDKKYLEVVYQHFKYSDQNNSRRVFAAISKL